MKSMEKRRWTSPPPVFYIEGIDGSGKTTQVELLTERLRTRGLHVAVCIRPGDNPIGNLARKSTFCDMKIPETARALLFAADQILVDEKIKRIRGRGVAVVCDRCSLSTFVYQEAKGCAPAWLDNILPREQATSAIFYLNVSVDTAIARLNKRQELSEFETREFLAHARNSYDKFRRLDRFRHRVHVIDAEGRSPEATAKIIEDIVDRDWVRHYA